jgi:hypothetical protein
VERRVTVAFGYQRSVIDALIAALLARPAAGLLTTPTIRLCSSLVNPGGSTALASITEATFNGYAPFILGAGVGPLNTMAQGRAQLFNCDFIAGAGIVDPGETITGYYLTDSAMPATLLYGGELFNQAVPFVNPGDSLSLDVLLSFLVNQPTGETP